jgi:hypothetical protein
VALYLVGSACLLALAGCGRGWLSFEEREPWRREAEVACVKSGAVRQGAAAVPIRPIAGPGICGADHPFKIAALGDRTILGYRDEMRPPGAIPRGFPIPEPRRAGPEPVRYSDPPPAGGGPMSIHPPGAEPVEEEELEEPENGPGGAPPPSAGYPGRSGGYGALPRHPEMEREPLPRLGPSQETAASTPASVVPAATLACPLVSRLDQWMAGSVQPAAQRWFGQPVVEIKQISAYSCRGMNGNPRARISEHAFGNALDIAAFTLADGRRVTVKNGWRGAPEEQGFLRDVHAAACEHFSTVLAPGSNRFHYDHIHVDLARRRSGRGYCNPAAVPGELIARRAQDRLLTGSVASSGRLGFAPEEARGAIGPQLPRAVPGED